MNSGKVLERLNRSLSKSDMEETPSRVRIPPFPLFLQKSRIKKSVGFLGFEKVLCIFENLKNLRKYKTYTDLVEVESLLFRSINKMLKYTYNYKN